MLFGIFLQLTLLDGRLFALKVIQNQSDRIYPSLIFVLVMSFWSHLKRNRMMSICNLIGFRRGKQEASFPVSYNIPYCPASLFGHHLLSTNQRTEGIIRICW